MIALVLTGFLSSAYKRERLARAQAHFNHGEALTRSGDLKGAVEEYRKALLFSPDEQTYRLSLAVDLVNMGNLDEARSHLEELLQDEPTNGLVNLMLARVALKENKQKDAVDFYQRAVYGYWPHERIPERHQARWELVALLEKEGRRNELIGELLQLYANAPPNDEKEKARIGFLLLNYGAVSDALNVFRELARDAPRYVESHHGLGQAYLDSGDFLSARRELQRAIHIDANDQDSFRLLAFTNSVIDIDPVVPRLPAAERSRRSRELLNRVLSHLETCSEGATISSQLRQRLDAAQKLLASKQQPDDDLNLQLQDTAQALWNDQNQFCGDNTIDDKVLTAVLSRIGHE